MISIARYAHGWLIVTDEASFAILDSSPKAAISLRELALPHIEIINQSLGELSHVVFDAAHRR